MTKEDRIREKYYDHLWRMISNNNYHSDDYSVLIWHLYDMSFYSSISMDEKRSVDGRNLRYQFGSKYGIDIPEIRTYLDNSPCSILELMIALAIRYENLCADEDFGDRTSDWFWEMIDNLGLIQMTDDNYDPDYASSIVFRFLNREYSPDGTGGLFQVPDSKVDLRQVDIWYQMQWRIAYLHKKARQMKGE